MSSPVTAVALYLGWLYGATAPASPPAPPSTEVDALDLQRDGAIALSLRAPAECGTELAIREAVDRFVTEPIDPKRSAGVIVDVSVDGTATALGPLTVRVTTPVSEVERVVQVARCEAIVDVAGVIIAVALDHLPNDTPSTTSNSKPSQPSQGTFVSKARDAAGRPSRRWGGSLRADGVFEMGGLPGIGGGVALATGLHRGSALVELFGVYLPPRTVTPFAEYSRAGASIQLGVAGLRGCYVPKIGKVEVSACAAVEGGAMRARGRGLVLEYTAHDAWAAVSISAALAWVPMRRFAITVRAEGLALLFRPRFLVADLGQVFHAPRTAVRVYLGPEVRF